VIPTNALWWHMQNVVLYAGSAADRAIIEQYEFRHDPKVGGRGLGWCSDVPCL
jgi:hypothetical protein